MKGRGIFGFQPSMSGKWRVIRYYGGHEWDVVKTSLDARTAEKMALRANRLLAVIRRTANPSASGFIGDWPLNT